MNNRLKVFLLVSVLLNMLLAGAVLGHFLHRPPPPDRGEEVSRIIKDPALKEQARKLFDRDGGKRGELRKAREATLDILTAEKFDAKAYINAMDKMHGMHESRRRNMAQEIAGIAEKLSREERVKLADILRRPPPPPPPHGK